MLKPISKKGKKTQSKATKQPKRKRATTRVSLPMNTGIQTTAVPTANSYGGIPYTSSQNQFGLTNKPPYLLESLIAKAPPTNYLQPTPAPTSSVTQGANIMTQTRSMVNQTKTQSVDFIDLVSPAKKGNNETQPEYIALEPDPKLMKQTLVERSEYRRKNNIPAEKKVSEIMTAEQHGFIKPKPKPTLRGGIVQGPPEKSNELRKR